MLGKIVEVVMPCSVLRSLSQPSGAGGEGEDQDEDLRGSKEEKQSNTSVRLE